MCQAIAHADKCVAVIYLFFVCFTDLESSCRGPSSLHLDVGSFQPQHTTHLLFQSQPGGHCVERVRVHCGDQRRAVRPWVLSLPWRPCSSSTSPSKECP